MIECSQLSDRMVEVLHRGRPWTGPEAAHLASCADCAAEWAVVSQGAAIAARVAPIDGAAMAARVRARLDASKKQDRVLTLQTPRFTKWAVGLAAAAVLSFGLVRVAGRGSSVPIVTPAPVMAAAPAIGGPVLTELDELSTTELERIWKSWGTEESTDTSPGLGDLNTDELERVLRSWEG